MKLRKDNRAKRELDRSVIGAVWKDTTVKHTITGPLIAIGLLAVPISPARAQSIDFGPGGVRVDPRSPRERERDEIRRDAIRRDRY